MYTYPLDIFRIPIIMVDIKRQLQTFQPDADQPQKHRLTNLQQFLETAQSQLELMEKALVEWDYGAWEVAAQADWKKYCASIKYDTHFSQRKLTSENIFTLMNKINKNPIPLIEHLQRSQDEQLSKISGFKSARQYPRLPDDYSIVVTKENERVRYWLLTPLCVAKATNRGIVKVVFPISSENYNVSIDFSKPYGCKIQYLSPGNENNPAFFEISKIMYDEAYFLSRPDRHDRGLKEYTIMTLYPGYPLNRLIKKFVVSTPVRQQFEAPSRRAALTKQTLNLKQKIVICLGVAKEVKKFHAARLINLDMKADNVIINPHPTDPYHFSIRLIDADNTEKTGEELSYCAGTTFFQPPEIRALEPGKPAIQVRESANIYTLGQLFLEIFLGYFFTLEQVSLDNFIKWRDDYIQAHLAARSPLVALTLLISNMMKGANQRPALGEVIQTLEAINQLFTESSSIMWPPVKCPEKPIPIGAVLVISRPAEAIVCPASRSPSPMMFDEHTPLLKQGKKVSTNCCVIL